MNTTDLNLLMLTPKFQQQKKYWLSQLEEGQISVSLPYDYELGNNNEALMEPLSYYISNEMAKKLIYMSKNSDVSLYLFLLTSLKITLYKCNGINQFAVGSPVHKIQNSKNLINKFVALVDDISEEDNFKECLLKVKETTVTAYENQEYPIEKLIKELVELGRLEEENLFKVICLLTSIHDEKIVESYCNDIVVLFEKHESAITLKLSYNSLLFSKYTIELFVKRYINVLRQVTDNPLINMNDINILSEEEKDQILNSFRNVENYQQSDKILCEVFSEQVKKTPNKIAIEFEGKKITYKELDERSNQLARLLRDKDVNRNVLVAVLCERSIEMIMGVLAIFKAGGAYIPIDKNYPLDRIKEILVDSKVNTIVTMSNIFSDIDTFYNELGYFTQINNVVFLDKCKDLEASNNVFKTVKLSQYAMNKKSEPILYKGKLMYENLTLEYEEYMEKVNKLSCFINKHKLEDGLFGVIVTNPINKIIISLALVNSKSSFVNIKPELSIGEITSIINEKLVVNIISESMFLDKFDQIFWELDTLKTYILHDEYDIGCSTKEQDFKDLWNFVAEESTDAINDYGWKNSYDGERFSLEEMKEYINNFKVKLNPYLNKESHVLEIGCGHGLVYSEIVDKVKYYYATDMSKVIIEKNSKKAEKENIKNIEFEVMSASEISNLEGKNFDVIVCSSVIHYFPNSFYLEEVIMGAIKSLGEKGVIYLDDIMDLRKKKDLEYSTSEFKKMNPGKRTKTDWDKDLFVDYDFFYMLQEKYPEIIGWEKSNKLGKIDNELSRYRYDVVLHIDKTCKNDQYAKKCVKNRFRLKDVETYCKNSKVIIDNYEKNLLTSGEFYDNKINKISTEDLSCLEKYSVEAIELVNDPWDMCYVIYTSGSTGKPKGAIVEHIGMVNHLNAKISDLNLIEETKIVQNASHCFDISVWQMFAALMVGGCTYIYSNKLIQDTQKFLEKVEEDQITILQVVPSYLSAMLDCLEFKYQDLKQLQHLIVTGEEVKMYLVERWFELYKNIKLVNAYGPTEASDDITHYIIDKVPNTKLVPIGKPVRNLNIYILDNSNNIVPIGIAGEICVSGIGVGRGYLYNEEQTRKAFLTDSFIKETVRMYRTGDLGRWLPDGNIEYLGRIDNQVKIRGFRIELGEIEARLITYPSIDEAVVIDRTNSNGDKYLCAYVISSKELDTNEIKEFLGVKLPNYMIPAYFIRLDTIPLTSNGKIDRKSLPEPEEALGIKTEYMAARNFEEEKLVEVWAEVLSIKNKISINDNYFELGGDSIKAIQISARLQKYNLKVEIQDIFNYPTISELSAFVRYTNNELDQGLITGNIELIPIQKEYFDKNSMDKHYYNQSVMLYRKIGFKHNVLMNVFYKLLEHHDALRVVFKEHNGDIMQINRGLEEMILDIPVYDFTDYKEYETSITEASNKLQSTIDLENGPLFKLALFKTNEGDHLLIVIHHLIIDGVAWRILLEDISVLYDQLEREQEPVLPLKTTSFKAWAQRVKEYSQNKELLKEINYWAEMENKVISKLTKGQSLEQDLVRDDEVAYFTLSKEETKKLLNQVPEAYHTQINDILISSLVSAMQTWTGHSKILINLEGHGREEFIENINITRTVGWFTSVYPVILSISKSDDIATIIKNTKETLHRVPNKGVGYGILKYLTPKELVKDIKFNLNPEIGFNYFGQFDNDINTGIFQLSNISTGQNTSLLLNREHQLSINGMVIKECLELSICYNKLQYNNESIGQFMKIYKDTLVGIIDHCAEKEISELTASDFSDSELSNEDVEDFFKYIEE